MLNNTTRLLPRKVARGFASIKRAPLLQGFKVLELASVLAGPSVAQFLAELGASVIKVCVTGALVKHFPK